MALQCGTTGNGCPNKTGTYRIEYTIPEPSYVRYRYVGEAWKEIKDATQSLRFENVRVSQPPQPGQCPTRYSFFVRFRPRPTASWTNVTLTMAGNQIAPIRQMTLFLSSSINVTFDRESPPFLTGPPPDRFVEGQGRGGSFRLRVWGKNPQNNQELRIDYSFGNTGIFEIGRAEYLGMQRTDNQADNCAPGKDECTFRVLGFNNAVVYEEKRIDCPEAVIVPEAYGSKVESFVIGNSNPDRKLKIVNSEANNRKSTSILLGNTVIKKLDSPLGASLYPRVCWDCEEDKKCPEGTCTVECGDRTCCYNNLGISVKEFRK